MRSRAMRLILGAAVLLAFGGAASFVWYAERLITNERVELRAFEQASRSTVDSLSRLKAAQQAYVAEGQGAAFWIPEVAKLMEGSGADVERLREAAGDTEAVAALDDARGQLTKFAEIDRRARDYLRSGQALMAADVVFAEGGESSSHAARQVEAAALAEQRAFDRVEATQRHLQATGLVAAAVIALLALPVLAWPVRAAPVPAPAADPGDLPLRDTVAPAAVPAVPVVVDSSDSLRTAAAICTDIGRVSKLEDLSQLLAQAADSLCATGLIVWVADAPEADLRPAVAHGYSTAALTRLPVIPRAADNAAANAYRTETLQIVPARSSSESGALVAPLLSPAGCLGALTAEISPGVHISDGLQALARLFAAQLATVFAPSAPVQDDASSAHTATA